MSLDLSREALEATFSELTHLLIKPARLTVEEEEAELGAGGFGEVYLATLDKSSKSRRKVAVKQLRMVEASAISRRIALRLARELKVWAKVKHPNILELIGYYVSDNYVCAQFVSAFMANGNVMQYIKRSQVNAAIRLKFVRDIASGLVYLHEFNPPICHGDLKPANVLVNESLDAVLCDFGVSSFIHESGAASGLTTSKSIKGSLRYMGPELILQDDPKHTLQSDVWAWGCTAFEVMSGSTPYSTITNQALIMMEMYNKSPPGSMNTLSTVALGSDIDPASHTEVSSLQSIIPQCWDFNPEQRPPASRILQYIAVHSKAEARLGASEDQEGGISSLHIGDHSEHGRGASQSAVTPYGAHSLCMNCHKFPKVGGQDFCSKACLDDASSSLPASAQNNASSHRFAAPKFVEPDSPVSALNGRSTTPTLTSPLASPVKQQRHSYLSKPPPSSPQSTKMSNYSSQQSYGSGGPPPRPSRANTSNLNDIVSSSHPSSRRLSSPPASPDQYTILSLDPGDSPPSAINGDNTVGRSRSSTQGKNKTGMFSFISDFLAPAKRPEISTPYDGVHMTHVGFNSSTREYIGLPKEWQQILQQNGISRQDQERNRQAAGTLGKIADKYMATGPTANGNHELGESFQNPRTAQPTPFGRKGSSKVVTAPSGGRSTPQPYRPAPSAPVPSAETVTFDRSASTRPPVPPGRPTIQPYRPAPRTKPKVKAGLSDVSQTKFGNHAVETKISTPSDRQASLPTGTDMTQFESSGRAAGPEETMSIQPPPAPGPTRRLAHKPEPKTVLGGYRPPEVPGPPPVPPVPSARSRPGSVPTQPDKPHRPSSPSTGPDKRSPLHIDELRGLSSASRELSEKFKAWDRTGQLTERTKSIFTSGFSDVAQAKLRDCVVAVKTLRLTNITNGEEDRIGKRLAREIYVWAALDHPNVLRFRGFAIEDEKICLISPWCDNGTLQNYLPKFPDTDHRRLVREVAEGLRYLHVQKPPIIHGDLKTTNVLVTVDHVAKIGDFGSSRRLGQRGTGLTTSGLLLSTTRYNAPEILGDGEDPTLFSDVFSFAYVALETMTGKVPFWRIPNDGEIVSQVVFKKQTPSPEDHPGMENATWEVLRRCWNYKPSDRPHMVHVCEMLSAAGYSSLSLASVRPHSHRRGLPISLYVTTSPDVMNPSA